MISCCEWPQLGQVKTDSRVIARMLGRKDEAGATETTDRGYPSLVLLQKRSDVSTPAQPRPSDTTRTNRWNAARIFITTSPRNPSTSCSVRSSSIRVRQH